MGISNCGHTFSQIYLTDFLLRTETKERRTLGPQGGERWGLDELNQYSKRSLGEGRLCTWGPIVEQASFSPSGREGNLRGAGSRQALRAADLPPPPHGGTGRPHPGDGRGADPGGGDPPATPEEEGRLLAASADAAEWTRGAAPEASGMGLRGRSPLPFPVDGAESPDGHGGGGRQKAQASLLPHGESVPLSPSSADRDVECKSRVIYCVLGGGFLWVRCSHKAASIHIGFAASVDGLFRILKKCSFKNSFGVKVPPGWGGRMRSQRLIH